MLLSINEDKIAELLEAAHARYSVSASEVPAVTIENYQPAYPTTYAASGVVYGARPVTVETRQHLLEARQRIEESGDQLKSVDELIREIGEMRSAR